MAIVLVVVLLWVGGVGPFAGKGLAGGSNPPPPVTIRAATLSFDPSSNPCFSSYGTDAAFTLSAGGVYDFTVNVTSEAHGTAQNCTIEFVTVNTPGFKLKSANTPLRVPASGTAMLAIAVALPSSTYAGDLNLTGNATYVLPDVVVTSVNATLSPDTPGQCGITGLTGAGFTAFQGSTYNATVAFFVVSPPNACTITGVTANTSGFGVASSDTPYALPIDTFASVGFELTTPGVPFDGSVNITLALTT